MRRRRKLALRMRKATVKMMMAKVPYFTVATVTMTAMKTWRRTMRR